MTSKWAKGTGGPAGDETQNLLTVFVKAKRAQTETDDETWIEGGVAPTLNQFDTGETRATVLAISQNQRNEITMNEVMGLLGAAGGGKPGGQGTPTELVSDEMTYCLDRTYSGAFPVLEDVSPPLKVSSEPAVAHQGMAVRRLTPLECERLQGYPDFHTRWAADGTELADSHRYRMCGNGVAAPVAAWVGRHLMGADDE